MEIKINSTWAGNDEKVFTVTGLVQEPEGLWVHYQLNGTDKKFNCLSEAFTQRFSPRVA